MIEVRGMINEELTRRNELAETIERLAEDKLELEAELMRLGAERAAMRKMLMMAEENAQAECETCAHFETCFDMNTPEDERDCRECIYSLCPCFECRRHGNWEWKYSIKPLEEYMKRDEGEEEDPSLLKG